MFILHMLILKDLHSARLVYEALHFLQDTLELRLLESTAPATALIAQVVMAKVWPWATPSETLQSRKALTIYKKLSE